MTRLDSLVIRNFRSIRRAEISLCDIVVITGPENSGISDLLLVFPFLNFIINGSDEDLHAYFESGEAPDIGIIIKTGDKASGTVEFSLWFSDSESNLHFNYNLVLSWTKGKRDFIREENFGMVTDNINHHVGYLFNRNETQVKACPDLEVYLDKVFPDSEQSIIRILNNIQASLISSQMAIGLKALDDLLHTSSYYFSGSILKHVMLDSMFGSVNFANDLQQEIARIEVEKENWPVFKTMLKKYVGITKIECHHEEKNASKSEKSACYILFTQNGNDLFLNQLPDDAVHLVTLLTRIFLNQHHVFLMEEPEKSINPAHLQDMLEHLLGENYPLQFIISTHSVPLMNAVLPVNIMLAVADKEGMYEIENIGRIMNKKNTGSGVSGFGKESLFNIDSGTDN